MSNAPEVFSTTEIARAVGVSREAIQQLIRCGELRFIPGTRYVAAAEAVRAGRALRATPPRVSLPSREIFISGRPSTVDGKDRALPAVFSTCAHAALLLIVLWFTAGPAETAAVDAPSETPRLVFLVTPGPGGGGGGGGERRRLPAARLARKGTQPRVSVPAITPDPVVTVRREAEKPTPAAPAIEPTPVEREPEPAPADVVVAPVATAQADPVERDGVIDEGREASNSRGPGADAGSGTGQGAGNGEGLGSGIGDGTGGGTGGGPYRPGSGIEPPRLIREVKADYTEEARHRGLSGDVVLEIVVRRDGSVGDVKVLQGLGGGLEQRAIAAVRQWRFDPARRKGVPVDVIVEVAVEFTLR